MPTPPMIKFSGSLSGWSYPISRVAPRSDCIPPATVRNSKSAPESLNANCSFKYFGKGQGVSVYSFIDERDLLFHSLVFSAGERESAYVIDGLMHNDVVKSDIHSTDSFGFSEAIFGSKTSSAKRLYNFKSRRNIDRSAWQIKPTGYIDTEFIEQNWDDILRLIATIKLKETTASEIFRRLNSYSQQHSLYRALKGFGKIIKSIFILRYIDEVELQRLWEPRCQRISACAGDEQRNCNQKLCERVFDAALCDIKTVGQVHQENRSEHDDNNATPRQVRIRAPLRIAKPPATCASPTR
jgi:Tn3 transposase DDE domain-containing protein